MNKIQMFFKRIGMAEDTEVKCTFEFLKQVQYNAVTTIAYENLDILDGKPLSLSAEDLFEKIVINGRGGYCFEVNGLLSWFFKELGFEVTDYFARFLRDEKEVPMRRHRVLSVKCPDGLYFCDIGIGQIAPRLPLKMELGLVQEQFGEQYKFEMDKDLGWVLYDLHKGSWRPFISFTEEKKFEIDFLQPSFYCEKHPDSPFNKSPIIAIKTEKGRKTINNREYKVFECENIVHIEENVSDERFYELLKKEFNINYR
ncbi:MAG: arylamine N-acetyltransferase, partial [Clostridia bacterium]|nr:arylamine N-acetyltransferase [Clostridia bacterium]